MPLTITWTDVALRILLTIVTGAVIGFERGDRGHPAGLRTTLLVAVAACLAMLQANWLMATVGKAQDSFVVLDLMRLPLGILSGVGFIGGGTILRRDDMITGVTTAATLWFVTVVGLCFGGGQIALGIIGSMFGLSVLTVLRVLERRVRQHRTVNLAIKWDNDAIEEQRILMAIKQAGLRISHFDAKYGGAESELHCAVSQHALFDSHAMPSELRDLLHSPGVLGLEWKV